MKIFQQAPLESLDSALLSFSAFFFSPPSAAHRRAVALPPTSLTGSRAQMLRCFVAAMLRLLALIDYRALARVIVYYATIASLLCKSARIFQLIVVYAL